MDSNVFWIGLFVAPVVWTLLAFASLLTFRFMWMLLVLVVLMLCSINAYGYVKCKRDAAKKLQAFGGTVLTRGLAAWSSAQARGGSGGGSAATSATSQAPPPYEPASIAGV
jgi:hypothetical protein